MAKPRVKLNNKGIRELLRSKPVQAKIDEIGRAGAVEAGEGFEYESKPHKYTSRGFVQTEFGTVGAKRQAREKVLQKFVGKKR